MSSSILSTSKFYLCVNVLWYIMLLTFSFWLYLCIWVNFTETLSGGQVELKGLRFTGMWAGRRWRLFHFNPAFIFSFYHPSVSPPSSHHSILLFFRTSSIHLAFLSARLPLRCRALFPGFPPCQPCSTPCPEESALPVYPEASPCLVCPLYPVSPACPEVWTYPAFPGGRHCWGPSPCRLYLRLLGGCCRTAVLCWTIRHLEVTADTTSVTAIYHLTGAFWTLLSFMKEAGV